MADLKENVDPRETQSSEATDTQDPIEETEIEIIEIDDEGDTNSLEDADLDEKDIVINNLREGNLRQRDEITSLQEEILRSRADYENLKKRTTRERFEEIKIAKKAVFTQFLQILDNFERALQTENKDKDNFTQGLEMIHKQFIDVLGQNHVYEIKAEGTPFNPHMHEAMVQQPTNDHPENSVVTVFQKGYSFNGELLRPAQVSVATPLPETSGSDSSTDEPIQGIDETI